VTQEQYQGLAALRAELDRIDDEILDLIERRLAASADIAAQKDAEGDRHLKVRPKRQAQILQRLKTRAGSAKPELVAEIWRELMGASLQAQARTELVLAPSDQPELLEARVRAHFGSAPPIRWAASTAQAIRAALVGEAIAIVTEAINEAEGELRVFDVLTTEDGRPFAYAVGRVAIADTVAGTEEPRHRAKKISSEWSPESWRSKPAQQLAEYPDPAALARVERRLAGSESLVEIADIIHLRAALARVANGDGFIAPGRRLRRKLRRVRRRQGARYLQPAAAMGAMLARGERWRRCPSRPDRRPVRQAALVGDGDDRRCDSSELSRRRSQRPGLHRDGASSRSQATARGASPGAGDDRIAAGLCGRLLCRPAQPCTARSAFRNRRRARPVSMFTSHEALLLNYEQALTRYDERAKAGGRPPGTCSGSATARGSSTAPMSSSRAASPTRSA
jgi:chorismate mutase